MRKTASAVFVFLAILCAAQANVMAADNADKYFETYQIKWGDTLWAISEKLDVPMGDLLQWNPRIRNPDLIYAGYYLRYIPVFSIREFIARQNAQQNEEMKKVVEIIGAFKDEVENLSKKIVVSSPEPANGYSYLLPVLFISIIAAVVIAVILILRKSVKVVEGPPDEYYEKINRDAAKEGKSFWKKTAGRLSKARDRQFGECEFPEGRTFGAERRSPEQKQGFFHAGSKAKRPAFADLDVEPIRITVGGNVWEYKPERNEEGLFKTLYIPSGKAGPLLVRTVHDLESSVKSSLAKYEQTELVDRAKKEGRLVLVKNAA